LVAFKSTLLGSATNEAITATTGRDLRSTTDSDIYAPISKSVIDKLTDVYLFIVMPKENVSSQTWVFVVINVNSISKCIAK
jgi:hypothetical protein